MMNEGRSLCSKDFEGQFSLTFHFSWSPPGKRPLFRFPLSEAPAITVILLIQMASWNAFRRTRRTEEPCCSMSERNIQCGCEQSNKTNAIIEKCDATPTFLALAADMWFFPSSSNNSMISSELDVTSSNAFWYFITSTTSTAKSFSKTFWYVSERLHGRSVKTSLQSLN